jgi:glycosyltransferase involved in cell wall biosynthesis
MNSFPPTRILMTTDAVGGVWTYSTTLASALAGAGMEVCLVIMGPAPQGEKRAMLRDSRVDVIESGLALEWQDPQGDDLSNARAFFAGLEEAIAPDIVHLNSFREATFDWLAPVVVVAHSCVNSWARACNDEEWLSESRWQHYTRAVGAGLNRAQAWVSPSEAFHDVVRSLYRPNSPGAVIWNGITPAALHARSKRRVILAAGRMWDAAKNISVLARASNDLDWPVFVAGPTLGSSPWSDPGGLTLIGDLAHADLRARLQHAAIFVSPALYEPFGLSILEAAAAGCALVLSDIATFRELWDGAARFVDPTDDRALHRALAELCEDDRERVRLQSAARERSQRYALAHTVDAYRALYERLLASHAGPAAVREMEVHA